MAHHASAASINQDPKLAAISTSVASLVNFQKAIKSENIDSADVLATKFNAFASTLSALHSSGKNMDHSSMIEIPVELLQFLDGEISNPELYLTKSMDEHEKIANTLNTRVVYLKGIKTGVKAEGYLENPATVAATIVRKVEDKGRADSMDVGDS